MNKLIYIFAAVCLFSATPASAQDKTLTILHTNDTHSCIYPLNPNLADKNVAGRGGFIRRIEMLKQERRNDKHLLLFDSGDFSQGSPYYTIYKGEVEVKLMNRMGYDAGTIGNHEFDYGLENLRNLLATKRFPIVCSNLDFTGTPCEGMVQWYYIIKRKGVRIGVLALSPPLEGLVDERNCKGVKYLDPIQRANETAAMLKNNKKCDIVICLSHLGWGVKGIDDQKLIANTRNIDLVLGGHSHSFFDSLRYVNNLDGKPVPVDQQGKSGLYVGKIKLHFAKQQ